MRVLAISGSLRRDSYNTRLLRAAEELAPEGVELELYDGLADVPPYDADLEGAEPEAVRDLRDRIAAADAVLVATPEYNLSIPGQLKNALDWASRPFPDSALWGKAVAIVGASTGGYGAAFAQADLRRVLGRIGARAIESGLAVSRAATRFDAEGRLVDAGIRTGLAELLDRLAGEAGTAPETRALAAAG